jgi:hypothetical protein
MFERQQFDLLLHEAAGNFVERIVHRCGGPEVAWERLRVDPESEGVWLSEFVTVVFDEHLLNSPEGSCFVLQALAKRALPPDPGGSVTDVLARSAHLVFSEVLAKQAGQLLQQQLVFQPEGGPS